MYGAYKCLSYDHLTEGSQRIGGVGVRVNWEGGGVILQRRTDKLGPWEEFVAAPFEVIVFELKTW